MRTGRSRFRLQPRFLRRALVVLEVEVLVPVNFDRDDAMRGYRPRNWYPVWRDARSSDLEVTQEIIKDPVPGQAVAPPPRSPDAPLPPRPER